jgi:hypothetical protein
MDATKVIASVLVAVAIAAAAFGAYALTANKSAAESFAWRNSGYNPTSLAAYTVQARVEVPGANGTKAMRLRVQVPGDTAPNAVRNAMLDSMRTVTLNDKAVTSVTVFADYADDPVHGEKYSALKGVWAPVGASGKGARYEVKFIETTRPRHSAEIAKPKPEENPWDTDGDPGVGFGVGSGGG